MVEAVRKYDAANEFLHYEYRILGCSQKGLASLTSSAIGNRARVPGRRATNVTRAVTAGSRRRLFN